MKVYGWKYVLLSCTLLVAILCQGQRQNDNWRFGFNGGLTFNPNGTVSVVTGETFTQEGSSAISDRTTGQLLFYSDGVTLWNANNVPMLNGTGLLGGSPDFLSSTTAAAMVRQPGSETRYYVFTIDQQDQGNGLRYSIVDMTLDGGLGGVVNGQKNIPVFNTTSEKLQIIPNAANDGYWVITHDNQESFYCFALTASGLSNTPVISNVSSSQFNGAGHIKMNRTFDKLALGSLFEGNIGLYPFDNATGVFSEPIEWQYTYGGSPLQYGMEFSPNGQVLYASNLERIIQYDLSSGDPATIQASGYLVFQGGFPNGDPASLQLAPNRKIYCNVGASIGVINCPDLLGAACGWSGSAFQGVSTGGYGLHSWSYDLDAVEVSLEGTVSYTENCTDVSITFEVNSPIVFDAINLTWSDGGVSQVSAANEAVFTRTFAAPGDYLLSVEIEAGCELVAFDTLVTIVDCTPPVPDVPQIVLQGDTCNVSAPLTAQVLLDGTYDQVTIDFGDAAGTEGEQRFTNVTNDVSAQYVYSVPGTYSICVRAVAEGLLDTTVCMDVTVGLCCEFDLVIEGTCTELPSVAQVIGTNAVSIYAWSILTPSGATVASDASAPDLLLSEAGSYVWQVTLDGECGERTLTQSIDKLQCEQEYCSPFVPNTFTPNNDGLNEVFAPVFACGEVDYKMNIFNRWGEKIFDTDTDGRFWNGGANGYYVSDGVYFYVIEYPTARNVKASVTGHVTVVR